MLYPNQIFILLDQTMSLPAVSLRICLYRFSARDGLEDAMLSACANKSDVEAMFWIEYEEELQGDASRACENKDDASDVLQ